MATEDRRHRQVFISYSLADRDVADRVTGALRNAGQNVLSAWGLGSGDSIAQHVEQSVVSSDFLVVLLSPRSIQSSWVQNELSAALVPELSSRAITIIPVLLEDCEFPLLLKDNAYIDFRRDFDAGLRRLTERLSTSSNIDFSSLDPQTFERLVADLLTELGFSVRPTAPGTRDSGFDFTASYQSRDPFGVERKEMWLVEAKFYREQRLSVSALQQMFGFLITSNVNGKGLVVTNGRMTSVAKEFLTDISRKSGQELRVIDGGELTTLLLERPSLVKRYFAHGGSQ